MPEFLLTMLLYQAASTVGLIDYVRNMVNQTKIFETDYVNPDDVTITFPEEKRNLIYIYLESMETTFFGKEEGGALEENIIPELYELANDNINFSQTDSVGGFLTVVVEIFPKSNKRVKKEIEFLYMITNNHTDIIAYMIFLLIGCSHTMINGPTISNNTSFRKFIV